MVYYTECEEPTMNDCIRKGTHPTQPQGPVKDSLVSDVFNRFDFLNEQINEQIKRLDNILMPILSQDEVKCEKEKIIEKRTLPQLYNELQCRLDFLECRAHNLYDIVSRINL